nr:hypothetical protein [Escherichia coli]
GTADRNRSHWSTSKTPSYTKSVSWQHHPIQEVVVLVLKCALAIAAVMAIYCLAVVLTDRLSD